MSVRRKHNWKSSLCKILRQLKHILVHCFSSSRNQCGYGASHKSCKIAIFRPSENGTSSRNGGRERKRDLRLDNQSRSLSDGHNKIQIRKFVGGDEKKQCCRRVLPATDACSLMPMLISKLAIKVTIYHRPHRTITPNPESSVH